MVAIPTVLFGLGKMGGFHLKTLRNDPCFEVVAIVDPAIASSPEDARERSGGIRVYSSAAELKGIPYEVAVIASATTSHFSLAKAELLAGKHLLVEKPLAPTPEEASELIALAKDKDLCLAVGHVERSNPAIILAELLLRHNAIGEPVHGVSQRGGGYPAGPITGNDVLIDLAVHDLDVFSYLLGEQKFQSARCHAVSQPSTIDLAELHTLTANGGATCTAVVNWHSPHRVRELRLIGSEGVLEVDYLNQQVTLSGFHVISRLSDSHSEEGLRSLSTSETGRQTLANGCEQMVFAAPKQDALSHQLDQFHNYLTGKPHRLCVAERTADTIQICQQAKEQFNRFGATTVPELSQDQTQSQPSDKPSELN